MHISIAENKSDQTMENYIEKNKNVLQRIDDTLVNLINEGRDFSGIREKVLNCLLNTDRIIITTNISEYNDLRNMFQDSVILKEQKYFWGSSEKEELKKYSTSWFWVVKNNEVKSGTSGISSLEHYMDLYPHLPITKIKYNKY